MSNVFDYHEGMSHKEKVLLNNFLSNGGNTWTNVTYENSWVDFGSDANGDWQGVRYKKDMWNRVWVEGATKNGTTTGGITLFTLPAGYRPAKNIYTVQTHTNSGGAHAICHVLVKASDGAVKIYDLDASTRVNISFSFEATQ